MSLDRLQKVLEKEGGLSNEAFQEAVENSKKGVSLVGAIEKLNIVPEQTLLNIFSKYYRTNVVDLEKVELSRKILDLVPRDIVQHLRFIPLDRAGNNIVVATSDPRNLEMIDAIRFKVGYFAKAVLASETKVNQAIERYYGKVEVTSVGSIEIVQSAATKTRKVIGVGIDRDDGPIIKFVNDLLVQCASQGASDIHIEVYEDYLRVRFRIDGALVEVARPPITIKAPLISRVKIMAGMNIAENRLPQDGAINIKIGNKPIDFRVNTLPSVYGEKIVMRILDKSNLQVDMTQLGFDREQLDAFKGAIESPHGMILVTGPTGSGKTTTLYSALSELNKEDINVVTAEDPVEYNLPGINQVQMKSEIGLNFAASLRAFLRQDPDIIMVGEVRDLETAEIAIKAALTGHLVLSTLHTNGAADTISRLMNMGVAGYNLVAALNCVTAQRLARKICDRCRAVDPEVTEDFLRQMGMPASYIGKVKGYRGVGCSYCGKSGSKGRIAIHEVLIMNDQVKRSILNGDAAIDIKKVAMNTGMRTLRQSALIKMVQGVISAAEVLRMTASDSSEKGAA